SRPSTAASSLGPLPEPAARTAWRNIAREDRSAASRTAPEGRRPCPRRAHRLARCLVLGVGGLEETIGEGDAPPSYPGFAIWPHLHPRVPPTNPGQASFIGDPGTSRTVIRPILMALAS